MPLHNNSDFSLIQLDALRTRTCKPEPSNDPEYSLFLRHLQSNFEQLSAKNTLFIVDTGAVDLFDLYLYNISMKYRQFHNCRCCKNFINKYGKLVTINENGNWHSAVWTLDREYVPRELVDAIKVLKMTIEDCTIEGVFLSSDKVFGNPTTNGWTHLSIISNRVFKETVQTSYQASAEKTQDHITIKRALTDWTTDHLEQAVKLLETGSLDRSEKVLGNAQWLFSLKQSINKKHQVIKDNLIWRAIAVAPAGFCHPRSSMLGTLLDDIKSELDFNSIKKKFGAKVAPTKYMRPTAAPSEGQIAQAQIIFDKLDATGSLKRRYCRIDEVQALWRPIVISERNNNSGLFSDLKTKSDNNSNANSNNRNDIIPDAITITWDKFQRTVLNGVNKVNTISIKLPNANQSLGALVTSVYPTAPPILQWDFDDRRNPVSWYVHTYGSLPREFSIEPNTWVALDAICYKPNMWRNEDDCQNQAKGVMFLIKEAKETRSGGLGLFPEILKAEFHCIRSVLESYSNVNRIEGITQPHAAGLFVNAGQTWNINLLVSVNGKRVQYKLDRWD